MTTFYLRLPALSTIPAAVAARLGLSVSEVYGDAARAMRRLRAAFAQQMEGV